MARPNVLHCTLTRADRGSVPYLVQSHLARDASVGLHPRAVSFFDPVAPSDGAGPSLAGHGWETIGALRRRFAAAATAEAVDVAIYHEGWGMDWFAPLDRALRRVVFLHTERPHLDRLLQRYAPRIDGVVSVSTSMSERVRRMLPDFPAERVLTLPYFCEVPPQLHRARPAGPPRFGYAGRIVREQKHLERLPDLLAELDHRGVDYRFEVLGAGPYLPELRQRLCHHPRVSFLPWCEGAEYWSTLARWRAIVLLSDFEGFSRATAEAILAGALPVYPDFSPAAREIVGPAATHGLYPVGDTVAAAVRLEALARMDPAEVDALSAACRSHLSHLTPERYFARYAEFLRSILAAPSRARPPSPPRWHDWMLLGVYTRLFPLRF